MYYTMKSTFLVLQIFILIYSKRNKCTKTNTVTHFFLFLLWNNSKRSLLRMRNKLSDHVKLPPQVWTEFFCLVFVSLDCNLFFPSTAFHITVGNFRETPSVVRLVTIDGIAQVIDCQNIHGSICGTLSSSSTFPSLYTSLIGKQSLCVSRH